MKYFLFLAFVSLINVKPAKTDFTGEWYYKYSLAGDEKLYLADDFILGTKLLFEKCNDKKELKDMPPIVVELRRKDTIFSNISLKAYSKEGNIIDTFFPASYSAHDKQVWLTAYGKRLKYDMSLNYSKKDTIALKDNRVRLINGKKYSSTEHIYIKQQ